MLGNINYTWITYVLTYLDCLLINLNLIYID